MTTQLYDTLIIYRAANGQHAWTRGVVSACSVHEATNKALNHQTQYIVANVISVEAMLSCKHRDLDNA